jgi:hypothetical protein
MLTKNGLTVGLVALALGAGFLAGRGTQVAAQGGNRVFEFRTYTTENKAGLDALVARMRAGEARLFEKEGMKGIGYFVATDAPRSENTYIYVLAHQSQDAAKASWDKFRADPEWLKLRETSAPTGPIKVESVFVAPTDFSPLK